MRYQLVRSKRKTLALALDHQGALTVRAPLRLPVSQIDVFVDDHWDWVLSTRERIAQRPAPPPFALAECAGIPYLGATLSLHFAATARVRLQGDCLLVPQGTSSLAPVLRFLDAQAKRVFTERVAALSAAILLHPQRIRISHAKGLWGSMSGRGTLSLNRALLHCPPDVVDYVIIHELCHIAHPNHSAAFWAKVENFLPAYRTQRAWLREHGALITLLPACP